MLVNDRRTGQEKRFIRNAKPNFLELEAARTPLLAQCRAKAWDQEEGAPGESRSLASDLLNGLCDRLAGRIAACRASPPPADGVYEPKTKAG